MHDLIPKPLNLDLNWFCSRGIAASLFFCFFRYSLSYYWMLFSSTLRALWGSYVVPSEFNSRSSFPRVLFSLLPSVSYFTELVRAKVLLLLCNLISRVLCLSLCIYFSPLSLFRVALLCPSVLALSTRCSPALISHLVVCILFYSCVIYCLTGEPDTSHLESTRR